MGQGVPGRCRTSTGGARCAPGSSFQGSTGDPPPLTLSLEPRLTQRPGHCPLGSDALEGKGPQRWPQKRLGRRLEEVAKAIGGGYCRLQMPLRLALGVTGTVAGRRLGALEGGGGRIGTLGSQSCWQTGSAWGPT